MTLSDRLYFELYSLVLLYVADDFEQVAGLPTLAAYGNTIVQGTSDQVPFRFAGDALHDSRHFCRIRGIPVLICLHSPLLSMLYPLYSSTNSVVFYCTRMCGRAATTQLCFSQGTRRRISLFCVSVADASAICDIVASGWYLTDCNIAVCGFLGLGWAGCGQGPVRRLYGKVGRCQRADVVGDTAGKVSRPSHNLAVVISLKQREFGRGDSVGDDRNDICHPQPNLRPRWRPRWGEGTFETGAILYRAKVGIDGLSGRSETFPKKGAARA